MDRPSTRTSPGAARPGWRHRLALAAQRVDEAPPRPTVSRLIGEFDVLAEPLRRPFRALDISRARRPATVLLVPGFATHPLRMRYLARQLERAGHRTFDWGMGFNWGASAERLDRLERRLCEICDSTGERAALIGWSLGGLFARELAKRRPDQIRKVITLGTPFSGSLRANHAWRVYQLIAGHSVDDPPIRTDPGEKPPVETIALWSPRDGVVSPRSARGLPSQRDRAIALRCTHLGFTYAPDAIAAMLELLYDEA